MFSGFWWAPEIAQVAGHADSGVQLSLMAHCPWDVGAVGSNLLPRPETISNRCFVSLDFSPLENAAQRLDEGLVRYDSDPSDVMVRDGLVQRFEFTYELSHKMLRRFMEASAANPTEFDEADFQYLIRSANEQNLLLGAWPQWRVYRDMRSKTSHTSDEEVALKVVAATPDFLTEARYLLEQLQRKQRT